MSVRYATGAPPRDPSVRLEGVVVWLGGVVGGRDGGVAVLGAPLGTADAAVGPVAEADPSGLGAAAVGQPVSAMTMHAPAANEARSLMRREYVARLCRNREAATA